MRLALPYLLLAMGLGCSRTPMEMDDTSYSPGGTAAPAIGAGGVAKGGTQAGGSGGIGRGGAGGSPGLGGNGGISVGGAGGDSVPILAVDRGIINFGTLVSGTTSVAVAAVLNVGKGASGAITVIVPAGVTATGCNGPLAAGTSCTITLTASPTAVGTFSGVVSIGAKPGADPPLQISVFAIVVGDLFTVSPTSFDLGNIIVGAIAPKQVITISAKLALTDLVISTSGQNVSVDKVASTCTTMLAAGASCSVVVNFLASTAGAKKDSIVISGGGSGSKTITVPITANAQMPAKLVISPSTAQTFAASVGLASSAITFSVANSGDVATGVLAPTIAGANSAWFSTVSNTCLILAPLSACVISVVFKPTAMVAGGSAATLTVTDTGPMASTVIVPLSGTVLSSPHLVIVPATSDLGSTLVGTISPSTVFTIQNPADIPSGAITVTLAITDFTITNDTCSGVSLEKNGSCTLSIALKPSTAGQKNATLVVSCGALFGPTAGMLTGTGLSASTGMP